MIIVDNIRMPRRVGRISGRWSHLTATTPEELHELADRIGLSRSWFQDKGDGRWHYDVTDSKRDEAIRAGAVPVDIRVLGAFVSARRREGLAAADAVVLDDALIRWRERGEGR